jgi:hypothetical protein
MKSTIEEISVDIDKATKAAEGRVRKATLVLEKLGKEYRKLSIAQHKK